MKWRKEIPLKEYEIIKHILENDKDIIPNVFDLDPKYVVYEEYSMTYEDSEKKPEYDSIISNLITRLHKIGIIHCDLHSSNIMINDVIDNIDIRLIDFDNS